MAGSLGDNASIYAKVSYGTGDNDYKILNGSITSSEISEFYTENDQNYIELKWNEAKFSEPYTFTGNETDVFYGYFYTQEKNATPVLFGKQTDATDSDYPNMFLISGVPSSGYEESVYYISSEKAPYVPCFQLIVEQDGESSVSGIDSAEKAVARQYYSVDGKQLSAPQKGLNIVKMSDGTTMKVVK